MKKLSTLVLALALVLSLTCIGTAEEEPLRIILSNAYYTAPYCAAYNPSAEATARSAGHGADDSGWRGQPADAA